MDRAIVERAVRALAALNTGRVTETRTGPAPVHAPVSQARESKDGEVAPCGSAHCAGCYDVGDGKKIHPPKIGEDYQKWLEQWKAEGRVQ